MVCMCGIINCSYVAKQVLGVLLLIGVKVDPKASLSLTVCFFPRSSMIRKNQSCGSARPLQETLRAFQSPQPPVSDSQHSKDKHTFKQGFVPLVNLAKHV